MNNQGFIVYNVDTNSYERGFCAITPEGKVYKIKLGIKNEVILIENALIQYDTGCRDINGNIIYNDSEIEVDRLGKFLVKLVDGEYRAYSKKDGSFEILNMIADKSKIIKSIKYNTISNKFIKPYCIIREYVNNKESVNE